ncbi:MULTISPECIES: 16S rRNA (cytidine(1402)-2'-O)-methyltransferase [Arthrobacter]|uniref:Ribosomal RNA small subunit methyltransferase I n=2 Tax=Arthrobacter TaxID=1663 RepID=A0ABU9KPB7_9MICC|nr:16S rRNA (cytidine(1402)-2'-O)-methyltransferase [Arthrobacter sp. YJM1]MDP5227352.1 16S rRNA (cytidine(1402)-2'-O)-methyltransferase [Arthrobacter sp. YJM1]
MSESAVQGEGRVVLAATPIGNLGDASPRLCELLESADVVAAEDTRRLHRLVQGLGLTVSGRVISYHEHNERERAEELLEMVRDGQTILVVSDAGMPAVSDPGFRLVSAAVEAGVLVTAVPGPSAVLTALALSGLPTDRFTFEGFLPRKNGERLSTLRDLAAERRTMVFFEAPHRLEAMLGALAEVFGTGRGAAVCRELTKTYEEVIRGSLGELLDWAASGEVRGEIAVVVGGAGAPEASRPEDQLDAVAALTEGGMRLKEAVAVVAEAQGVSKRELYQAVLAARS